jgi:hypothetical protein
MALYSYQKEVNVDRLELEIRESAIVTALDYISLSGDALSIYFKDDLTSGDETLLDQIVDDHENVALPTEASAVAIDYLPAFAAKTLTVDGVTKKLFKRVHGTHATIPANSTANIDFTVPYATAKFSGAELIGCAIGDVLDYTVHDTATNTYSQAPVGVVGANYQLNKFGYAVELPDGYYSNTSNYDADIYSGMIIRCTYTNNGNAAKYIAMNVWLHEVKS